jgi:hypothetical protein
MGFGELLKMAGKVGRKMEVRWEEWSLQGRMVGAGSYGYEEKRWRRSGGRVRRIRGRIIIL